MGFIDRLKALGETSGTNDETYEDSFSFEVGHDGVARVNCWFCDEEVAFRPESEPADVALVFMEVLGTKEHFHGLAHRACAARSNGALAR